MVTQFKKKNKSALIFEFSLDNFEYYSIVEYMKKLILFIVIINSLYANDAWVDSSGGSIKLFDNKNSNIQMVSETIKIDLYNNYYEMDIEFNFFNYGETIELQVGFPEYTWGTTLDINNIINFNTTVNNERVEFDVINNLNFTPRYNSDSSFNIKSWYVRNIIFETNNYTVTRVHYRANYSGAGPYNTIVYLYGTGSTWKDNIDQMKIEVVNHTDYWLKRFNLNPVYILERINNNTIEINKKNVFANINDTFQITFSIYPAYGVYPYEISENRWRLRDELIPVDELALLNKEQLRILRNSIYAYHGYEFRSMDLLNYFNNQQWYKINKNFSENLLSINEKINIENIIREENKRD